MENQNPIKFSDCVKGPRNVGSIPKKRSKETKMVQGNMWRKLLHKSIWLFQTAFLRNYRCYLRAAFLSEKKLWFQISFVVFTQNVRHFICSKSWTLGIDKIPIEPIKWSENSYSFHKTLAFFTNLVAFFGMFSVIFNPFDFK